jgi:hypothetical protein
MDVLELFTVDEMLETFSVVKELYPSLTEDAYKTELSFMVQNNYSQVVVKDNVWGFQEFGLEINFGVENT